MISTRSPAQRLSIVNIERKCRRIQRNPLAAEDAQKGTSRKRPIIETFQYFARPPVSEIQKPMKTAMGIVAAIVNSPHGFLFSAFTTTKAITASRMIMIAKTASIAAMPADRIDLVLCHLAERLAVAPKRGREDDEVLNGTPENHASDEPDCPRQETKLRGECRTDERSGTRDRREVMPVRHPLVRRVKIAAVVEPFGRGRPAIVQSKDRVSEVSRIEPIGDQVTADTSDHEPGGTDRFTARERDDTKGRGAQYADGNPNQNGESSLHARSNDKPYQGLSGSSHHARSQPFPSREPDAVAGAAGATRQPTRVLSAQVHPELAMAAVSAVRQWRFSPTLLNGAPVEVWMTVMVDFRLSD